MVLLEPYPTKGLFVQVQQNPPAEAGIEPVIVHLAYGGPGVSPKVDVNGKPTSLEGLSDTLRDELKLRPKWVVYIQADSSIAWAGVVHVAELAKIQHAKVVLLTSKANP